MIRRFYLRHQRLPAFAACLLLSLLEHVAAAAIWQYGDRSALGYAALCVALFGGATTYFVATEIYKNRPRRPFYGRIDLEGLE